jgi:integrase
LDAAEVAAFVADLRTARDRAIALVMLLGGLRAGEVRSLLSDVDMGLRRVRVTGKGGRQRVVPVDGVFFTELAGYLRGERPLGCRSGECSWCCTDPPPAPRNQGRSRSPRPARGSRQGW